MTDAIPTLMGWCQAASGTKPDTYHNLCRVEITTQFGVTRRCSCPNHDQEDTD